VLQRERVLPQEKPKVRWAIDVTMDCEAPGAFYRAEKGGEFFKCFCFREKRGRGSTHFRRGKEHT
jgi:hypothetical protein